MVTKRYPPRFEIEAVALYRSRPEASIKPVADDLGINPETLRNWIRVDDGRRAGSHAPPREVPAAAAGSAEVEFAAARETDP